MKTLYTVLKYKGTG